MIFKIYDTKLMDVLGQPVLAEIKRYIEGGLHANPEAKSWQAIRDAMKAWLTLLVPP